MTVDLNATPAVFSQKAAEILTNVGLPTGGGWLQTIITILLQALGAGNGGLGACFGKPTGPTPPPAVIQAVQNPNGIHLDGLRGIVNHNVPQRGLRRPLVRAIRQSGAQSTPDEIGVMYAHANGVAAGNGGVAQNK